MNNEIIVCRLCFSFIKNEICNPLESSLKTMLGIITPNLKFEMTHNPVICKDCLNSVQNAFEFKTNFFEIEEVIDSKKEKYNLDCPTLSNLMLGKKRKKSTKVINYCRTCLVKIDGHLFIDLKKSANQDVVLILQNCLFEMDSSSTLDCTICLSCFNKLQEINKFKINCLKNEELINNYLKENPLLSGAKLSLYNVVVVPVKKNKSKIIKTKPINNDTIEDNFRCDNNSTIEMKNEDCLKNMYSVQLNEKKETYVNVKPSRKKVPKKRFFKCTECDFSTKNNVETIKHLLIHANAESHTCTKCSYVHHNKTELIRHIFSHVDDQSVNQYRALDKERKSKKN